MYLNNIIHLIGIIRFRRYYRHVLTLKFLKPAKHDAPTGMFLASAFGLQIAAQLAYGAPTDGSTRRRRQDSNAPLLSRANTLSNPMVTRSGSVTCRADPFDSNSRLARIQRANQSFYEDPDRR